MQEVEEILTANTAQGATKKKENAASLFDDFYNFGNEEEKKPEQKIENNSTACKVLY